MASGLTPITGAIGITHLLKDVHLIPAQIERALSGIDKTFGRTIAVENLGPTSRAWERSRCAGDCDLAGRPKSVDRVSYRVIGQVQRGGGRVIDRQGLADAARQAQWPKPVVHCRLIRYEHDGSSSPRGSKDGGQRCCRDG
jgi:hypothetical protein